jgi:hypothetical protein
VWLADTRALMTMVQLIEEQAERRRRSKGG